MSIHIWGSLAVACLLGILWRLFSRASKAYRSKLRSYPSRWAFVVANWDVFLIRTVFSMGLFALWLLHPALLSQLLIHFYVPSNFANWLGVTPTLGSAAAFGFLVDYALDQAQIRLATIKLPSWVPDAIKGEIPSYDTSVVNGTVLVQNNNRDPGFIGKTNGGNTPATPTVIPPVPPPELPPAGGA